jgi:hypothetical protein
MNKEEAIIKIQTAYDNCQGGRWDGESQYVFELLECYGATVMDLLKQDKWKDALRWCRRLIYMERTYGFEHTPIWGEFGETIEQLYRLLAIDSESLSVGSR